MLAWGMEAWEGWQVTPAPVQNRLFLTQCLVSEQHTARPRSAVLPALACRGRLVPQSGWDSVSSRSKSLPPVGRKKCSLCYSLSYKGCFIVMETRLANPGDLVQRGF